MSYAHSFSLPDGWAAATLPDLIGQGGGFSDGDWVESKDQDPDGDVRLTQLADVGVGRFLARSSRFLTSEAAARLRCTFLETGDVLVARMPDPLGRACMFPGAPMPCITVVDVCIVRPSNQNVEPRWLMWTINAPQFQAEVDALQSGTTRRRISRKNLATILLPIPPLPEQRRIVAEIETQFTRLDAAVAALERARANLKRYRAAVLEVSVNGPWRNAPLMELSRIQGGVQKQPKRAPASNAYPFLRVANVHRGRLNLDEVHRVELFAGELERLRLVKGDLLIVEGNGSPTEIGRMAIWDGSIANCVHQNHLIRIRLGEQLVPEFVEAYWNSPIGQQRVQSVASSTSGLYTLSVRKIGALSVPVPPLDEQYRVVQEVERCLSVVNEVESTIVANLKRAERMRQSILRKAFAGQLVPQDPDEEPAEALLDRIREERVLTALERPKTASRSKKGQYALW